MTAPAPAEPPTLVKLGGSVLTRKREAAKLRPKVLRRLCEELGSLPGVPLVVLHGAGSFGHPGARRFGLARAPPPGASAARRARGAALVSAEVRRLHYQVLSELLQSGCPAWSVPSAHHAENDAGSLASFDATPFRAALGRGMVPVSFGDVVPDRQWGWSILSADTIAVRLASDLSAGRMVFVSDVPGVLQMRSSGGPQVLAEVSEATLADLAPGTGAADVTGGIRGKVVAMLAIAGAGVDAGLISGLSDGALSRAVRGESVYGSWAHARRHA